MFLPNWWFYRISGYFTGLVVIYPEIVVIYPEIVYYSQFCQNSDVPAVWPKGVKCFGQFCQKVVHARVVVYTRLLVKTVSKTRSMAVFLEKTLKLLKNTEINDKTRHFRQN